MRKLAKASLFVTFAAGFAYVAAIYISAVSPATAQINMEEIFRCVESEDVGVEHCDRARELILGNCTGCHTFVPIVLQQFDAGAWRGLLDRHRSGRVAHLSDEDIDTIYQYLVVNFNEDLPPPEVPPALLNTWTSY